MAKGPARGRGNVRVVNAQERAAVENNTGRALSTGELLQRVQQRRRRVARQEARRVGRPAPRRRR